MVEPIAATNFSESWTRVDQTGNPSFYSDLLQATRAQLLERARVAPAEVFGPLGLQAGLRVLDVGCGTGDYLRIMAPLVAPGEAIGIDLSRSLIAHAQQLSAADAGAPANLSFCVGDAYHLPFPDASFDRVVATQVLLHLTDPWRAVREMRRVLGPAGRLSIGEWDWDSMCLNVTDLELGRRFTHLLCDHMHNGVLVRDVGWQLRRHGFAHIDITPQVRLSHQLDAAFQWLIEPACRELVRGGELTQQDGTRLLGDLRERAAQGRYFLARTYYSIIAFVDQPARQNVPRPGGQETGDSTGAPRWG